MAGCVALGAWSSSPVPVAAGVAVLAGGFAMRFPAVACVGAGLLAAGLGARAWDGLDGVSTRRVTGIATLVDDPDDIGYAVRAIVRLDGQRLQAYAHGGAAGSLLNRLAGERVLITGVVRPLTGRAAPSLRRRHVLGRLEVSSAEAMSAGNLMARVSNAFRRTLDRGAASIPDERRALLAGFLLGDDREQSSRTRDDFRAAGLTHLLAVSGQNVAFVIAAASPLLFRVGLRPRLVMGLVVLVLFGTMTRWEPSVLRAVAMAAVTMVAATIGRPASTIRVLALSISVLLLVDPLLVGSLGFLLSVGACLSIAIVSPRLAGALPGPAWLRGPLAVTIAAQIGVAPVLVTVFDGVPLASLPANLLAVPAAGPVMVWGLVAGMPAGILGEPVAAVLHVPTQLFIGWIASVARTMAALPLGHFGRGHLLVAAAMCPLVARGLRRRAHGVRSHRCSSGSGRAATT